MTMDKEKAVWRKVQMKQKLSYLATMTRDIYWRRQIDPENIKATSKHAGGSIKVWAWFAARGTGGLQKVNGILKKDDYLEILQENLKSSARRLGLGCSWVFQQEHYPKHASNVVNG